MTRPPRHPRANPPHWPHVGNYSVEVGGMSYYQENLEGLLSKYEGQDVVLYCTASLVPNPKNMHDSNAVEVRVNGYLIGHLYRQEAVKHHSILRAALVSQGPTTCDALLVHYFNEWYERIEAYALLAIDEHHPPKDQGAARPRHEPPVALPYLWGKVLAADGFAVIIANAVSHAITEHCFVGMEVKVFFNEENGNVHFHAPRSNYGAERITVVQIEELENLGVSVDNFVPRIMSVGERFVVIWFPLPNT